MNRLRIIFSIAVLATFSCLPIVRAADIQVGVSSEEAYVGFPVTLQVKIENASKQERPEIDDVDGLKIESMGAPSQSRRVTNINGQITSTTSSVYQWQVTPTREGTFTIPPIRVSADGMKSITKAVRITASESDPGDLLIVEVESNQDSVYVGEPIELKLKIYVKAYVDEDANIKLSDGSMWSLLSEQTQWGVFGEAIEQMTMNRMQPRGIEVIRKDAEGKDATYYRYQVDATLYPSRPGSVDLDQVKIGFEYPLEISSPKSNRRRPSTFESMLGDDFPFSGSMFGDSFFGGARSARRITKSMPLMIEPKLDSVVAKQIPTKGQPKEFAGAVGRYVIDASASETNVQAGDPVELTIRVRGTGQMDTIAAPPLSLIDAIANQFSVTNQPLAGQVDRDQKIFTTTIRPKDESVTEIPAIPFSYFDPDSGEYETSYSDPIPITVTPAEVLKLDRVARVGAAAPSSKNPESKTIVNESEPQLNLLWHDIAENKDRSKTSLRNIMIPAFALPPLVFLIGLTMRGYVAISRRSASEPKTLHTIKTADQLSEMSTAMNHYFARRWKVSLPDSAEGEPTIDHILGHLRSVGLNRYAVRVEQWMDQANREHSITDEQLESLRQSAMDIVKDAKSQRKTAFRQMIAAIVLFSLSASTCGSVFAVETTPNKPATLIQQAKSAYVDGNYSGSAQLLESVESESFSAPNLFVNLGNAFWQSGDAARSKASYLRALNADPMNDIARRNLLTINKTSWLLQKVTSPPMQYMLLFAIVAWVILWATLALRLWTNAFPWRVITSLCLVVGLVTGGIAFVQLNAVWFPHHAIIVVDEVKLRSGDGESFDVVQTIVDDSAPVVRWSAKRPGWVRITTSDGSQGWLPEDAVEIFSG